MMKEDNSAALIIFVFAVGAAIAIAIANDITQPLCRSFQLATSKTDKPYLGCLDFWFERYQTLLAALIGAAVALFVVRPVFQQLSIMNRQSAAQLRALAEQRARELEAERESLHPVAKIIGQARSFCDLYDQDDWHSVHPVWTQMYSEWQPDFRAAVKSLLTSQMRYSDQEMANSQRAKLAEALRKLSVATATLNRAFISGSSGLDPSIGEIDPTEEEMADARQCMNPAVEDARAAYWEFARAHDDAVKQSWEQANQYSAVALAGD